MICSNDDSRAHLPPRIVELCARPSCSNIERSQQTAAGRGRLEDGRRQTALKAALSGQVVARLLLWCDSDSTLCRLAMVRCRTLRLVPPVLLRVMGCVSHCF
jgi:hypothetical protein